eukprot:8015360-Lingulodinium_polyedra.AAC.1
MGQCTPGLPKGRGMCYFVACKPQACCAVGVSCAGLLGGRDRCSEGRQLVGLPTHGAWGSIALPPQGVPKLVAAVHNVMFAQRCKGVQHCIPLGLAAMSDRSWAVVDHRHSCVGRNVEQQGHSQSAAVRPCAWACTYASTGAYANSQHSLARAHVQVCLAVLHLTRSAYANSQHSLSTAGAQ